MARVRGADGGRIPLGIFLRGLRIDLWPSIPPASSHMRTIRAYLVRLEDRQNMRIG